MVNTKQVQSSSIKLLRSNFLGKDTKEELSKMKERIKEAIELKEQGFEKEAEVIITEVTNQIDKMGEVDESVKFDKSDNRIGALIDKSIFPGQGEQFAESERTKLMVLDDKEAYLSTAYEYSSMKNLFENEKFREALWEEMCEDTTFSCGIYMHTGEYIGYCSIKDMRKDDWEIAVELKSEYCNKGYGTEAIGTFLNEVAKVANKRFFCARVDIDNYASQALMRKLGGYPDGISEFMLRGNTLKEFQEENKYLIDDKIREVAKEFGMEAEDILGYVLVYRFDMGVSDGGMSGRESNSVNGLWL